MRAICVVTRNKFDLAYKYMSCPNPPKLVARSVPIKLNSLRLFTIPLYELTIHALKCQSKPVYYSFTTAIHRLLNTLKSMRIHKNRKAYELCALMILSFVDMSITKRFSRYLMICDRNNLGTSTDS